MGECKKVIAVEDDEDRLRMHVKDYLQENPACDDPDCDCWSCLFERSL